MMMLTLHINTFIILVHTKKSAGPIFMSVNTGKKILTHSSVDRLTTNKTKQNKKLKID